MPVYTAAIRLVMLGALGLSALAAAAQSGSAPANDDKRPAKAAARGYARVGVGLNVAKPFMRLPDGAQPTNHWTGVHYRTNWIELGYLEGRFRVGDLPTAPTENTRQYYLGGCAPIGGLAIGRRDGTRGMLLIPTISGGYCRQELGRITVNSWYAAPALSLQLPYVLIDLRARALYNADSDGIDGEQYTGFSFQPQLCLQFDGLWDVFAPRKSYDGHASGVLKTTEKKLVDSNAYYDTYRISTKSTPYDFDMYITGGDSFLAIAPRGSLGLSSPNRGTTWAAGLGLSGRASAFAFDIFGEGGQLGVNGAWSKAPSEQDPTPRKGNQPDEAEARFGGYRPAGRVVARGGLDLIYLFESLFFHSNGGGEGATKFFRITGGWGPGWSVLPGDYTFLHPERAAELDKLLGPQTTPRGPVPSSIVRNEFSDPRLGRGGYCNQWYAQLEVGVASLSFEANRYRNNPLANGNVLTLTYLYPYSLLKKAHRARRGQ